MSQTILSPIDQSGPEPQLGPEVGVLADGSLPLLPDFDQTYRGLSMRQSKRPGKF